MPVRKYRSIEEMPDQTWRQPGDPELFRAMRATWDLAQQTLRPHFPPGVYKHRCFADAERLSEKWQQANFMAYRARILEDRDA